MKIVPSLHRLLLRLDLISRKMLILQHLRYADFGNVVHLVADVAPNVAATALTVHHSRNLIHQYYSFDSRDASSGSVAIYEEVGKTLSFSASRSLVLLLFPNTSTMHH